MSGCGDCMFYQVAEEEPEPDRSGFSPGLTRPRSGRDGWCRRFAPKPLGGGPGTGWNDFEWPSVREIDWCGEWRPAGGDRIDDQGRTKL